MDNNKQPDRELDSWDEIASYLGISVRTAQTYQKSRGLPIRRRQPGARSRVFARAGDLDRWRSEMQRLADNSGRSEPPATTPIQMPTAGQPKIRVLGWLVLAACLAIVLTTILIPHRHPTVVGVGEQIRLSAGPGLSPRPPLMTAGQYLYFQESDQMHYRIMRTSLSERSAASSVDTPLANPDPGVVYKDGSAMLLRDITGSEAADQPLYVQPLTGGPPRRLGDIVAYDSAWTPDQRHIIFSKASAIYETTIQGTDTRRLFEVPGRAHWFRWSPNGKILRFSLYDAIHSSYRIWETDSLDHAPTPIPLLPFDRYTQQCCGAWSTDGSYFVFQAKIDDYFQLFAHTEPRRLFAWFHSGSTSQITTSGPVSFRSPLLVLHDSRLIALSQTPKTEVVQYQKTTGGWTPVLDGFSAATADYSRDGQWLAYTSMPDHSLFRCRMPGCSESIQLTFPPLRVTMPQWSPDGKVIAFMAQAPGKRWQVSLIPSEGGSGVPITDENRSAADPSWSSDGHRLAFGEPATSLSGGKPVIQMMDLDTKKVSQLLGSEGYNTPRWSRDGKFLAAVSSKSLELALYDFATGKWWCQPGIRVGYLNWATNSSRIFFLALGSTTNQQAVMALDTATKKATVVANLTGLRQPPFSFGDWIGIGRDDAPLALRDLSTEDILSWKIENQSSTDFRLPSGQVK